MSTYGPGSLPDGHEQVSGLQHSNRILYQCYLIVFSQQTTDKENKQPFYQINFLFLQ